MANKNLIEARKNKKDEFYTLYEDIHNEVKHYKDQLRDKVIYCNTDDPKHSNFWKYFYNNFKEYGLKKIVSTYYSETEPVYKTIYDGKEIKKERLKGNGSFDSLEALDILKEVDVVITNPPFSLYRQFVKTLIDCDVDFLIIGNNNSMAYKDVFPLIKENIIKIGHISNKTLEFLVDDGYVKNTYKRGDKYYAKVRSITWFTTLDVYKKNDFLTLSYNMSDFDFKRYVNFNGIEVPRVSMIPYDYDGVMGVPLTFLNKFNPNQFDIVGISGSLADDISKYASDGEYSKGGPSLYVEDCSGNFKYKRLYHRILIKHKKPLT